MHAVTALKSTKFAFEIQFKLHRVIYTLLPAVTIDNLLHPTTLHEISRHSAARCLGRVCLHRPHGFRKLISDQGQIQRVKSQSNWFNQKSTDGSDSNASCTRIVPGNGGAGIPLRVTLCRYECCKLVRATAPERHHLRCRFACAGTHRIAAPINSRRRGVALRRKSQVSNRLRNACQRSLEISIF
jgi:hypothetical protein